MTVSPEVRWPQGYPKFYKVIKEFRNQILKGRVLAVDPSSLSKSPCGYAVIEGGKLVKSGVIKMKPELPPHQRLAVLYDEVAKLTGKPDVLAIEEIRGSIAGPALQWSVGVVMAAARPPLCFEVPQNVWKALAKATPEYSKDDVQDAEMIGQCLILLGRKFNDEAGNS